MKAIRFNQYGEPAQVLAVQKHPAPEPGNEEVRVLYWLLSISVPKSGSK